MLFLLPALIFAEIPSLQLDDTYHEVNIDNKTNVTYWVQPIPSHSAIIVVHNTGGINGYQQAVGGLSFSKMSPTDIAREGSYVESRYTFTEENPVLFRLTCDKECSFVINHVHTDPVYRTSAIIGAFSLFVCLFLLVFSWTIFCGACRATRKR